MSVTPSTTVCYNCIAHIRISLAMFNWGVGPNKDKFTITCVKCNLLAMYLGECLHVY